MLGAVRELYCLLTYIGNHSEFDKYSYEPIIRTITYIVTSNNIGISS
jgi:hypothetical protein